MSEGHLHRCDRILSASLGPRTRSRPNLRLTARNICAGGKQGVSAKHRHFLSHISLSAHTLTTETSRRTPSRNRFLLRQSLKFSEGQNRHLSRKFTVLISRSPTRKRVRMQAILRPNSWNTEFYAPCETKEISWRR